MLLNAELDWIYEGKIDPRYREISEHRKGQSVFLLKRGSLTVRTPDGVVRAKAGEWILPTQDKRLQKFSEDAEVLSIHLQLHWPGGEPLFQWEVAAKFNASAAPQLKSRSERLRRLVERKFPHAKNHLWNQHGSLSTHARLRHYFTAWFCTFVDTLLALGSIPTRLGPIDPRIFQAIRLLDRFPLQTPFKVAEFARRIKLSPTHLDRLFVRQFGTTPRRYLEQRKREQAFTRLRYAAAPGSIKRIAFDLGFNSLAHFSGWFRHQAGLSPSQFQLQHSGAPIDG